MHMLEQAQSPIIYAVAHQAAGSAITREGNDDPQLSLAGQLMQAELQKRGLAFHDVDNVAFRGKLVREGFYNKWKKRQGEEAWALIKATTGKLG
jgi:hypothetical protein